MGKSDHSEPKYPGGTRQVEARVVALVPEYHQAHLRSSDGYLYSLTEQTPGIDLRNLHEGQVLRCTVTVRAPRVLSAHLVG
jgi:hypothetical protein